MSRLFVKITLAALCCVLTLFRASAAEKVTFEVDAPMIVAVDEVFRVEFSVNESPDDGSFVAPSFEGFELLAGPVLSTRRSFESINGSMTSSLKISYTYTLVCHEPGTRTIGEAEIAVKKRTYRTRTLPIEVVAERDDAQSGGGGGGAENAARRSSAAERGRVAKDDLLLRASVSRTSVFKGEPLRVSFKLCQRVNVVGFEDVKLPSFDGFWAQELSTDNVRPVRETIGGKIYETVVIKEYLLYPQQAGELVIDPAQLTAVAQVVVPGRNPDPFFGGPEVYNVRMSLQTQRITVAVKELPDGAPESFSGAVGSFRMETTPPSSHLAANSSATYVVKISGTGNMTFVQAPKLNLPGSFEQYNVKTIESINSSAAGTSGYRQFEYPFIARAEGTFELPPVEFTYFSPTQKSYVTLTSKPLSLEVESDGSTPGAAGTVVMGGRGLSKEEVKLLGQDIRFIKMGNARLKMRTAPFFGSGAYWGVLGLILLLFGAAYAALRKRIRESQNVALVRGKRANKVAVQRFRIAKRYMTEQNQRAFYEEMLRALWGYMGDKFNIPVANLTKESVREELHKRGVAPEVSQRFTTIISQCDEAQYSPVASAQMSDVYSEGVDLISRIEAVIKR